MGIKSVNKIFIFLFIIGVFFAGLNKSYIYNTKNLVGEKINIDLNDFYNNEEINEQSLKNFNFTLVNFWASWCLPCLVEHPILMALRGKENLTIIGINYKDNKEDASEFLREHGDPYDFIGIDKDGFFGIEMGITGVPETFVVDENGKVMIRHVGPIDFGNALVKP